MARQEALERLVVVCNAVGVQQDAGHEQSGDDREGRDRCEREDDPAQVRPDRVALAGQSGQPTAERTGLTVEDREGERARAASRARGHDRGW